MTFPAVPEDIVAEIFVNGAWTNITSDIRLSDQIAVTYGFSSVTRSSTPPPASCSFTVNNRSGNYSPRNPLGAYYRSLGQNTPLRIASRVAVDGFARSTASGLGTATSGGAWTVVGTASRFSTSASGGGAASLSWTTADGALAAYLAGYTFRDVEVASSFLLPTGNVTGGNMAVELLLNGVSTTDFFAARLTVTTAEAMLLDVVHVSTGTTIAAQVTVSDFVFTGQLLRLKAQLSGQTLRAKVWPAASTEPYAWHTEGSYVSGDVYGTPFADRGKGWIGLRAEVLAGNTNVPCVIKASAFEARINQFHGEATAWPTEWDVSGNDIFGQVEAAGQRRRLSQGQATLPSTYTRANVNTSPAHLLYYPCEDGSESTTIASGFPDQDPMVINTADGSPQMASSTDFAPGSAAIAKPNRSRWLSPRVSSAATGKIQLIFLLSVPSGGETDGATFTQIQCTGTVGFIDCYYDVGGTGSLHLKFYDQSRTLVHTSVAFIPASPHVLNGTPAQVSIELTQSGSDIGYVLSYLIPGDSLGTALGGTVTGYTIGAPLGFHGSPYGQVRQCAIGHIALRNDITSIFTNASALNAYNGEGIRPRMIRLCAENDGVNFERTRSTINAQVLLGKQKQKTFLELLDEAVKSDMGFLLESRDIIGLVLLTMRALYNRDAFVTLDYAAGQVQPPFKAVDDDALIINDFTASKEDGSSYRATQDAGPFALTSPTSGQGVGRYNDSDTFSLQNDGDLADIASWTVHLGTLDESRFPSAAADLSKLAVTSRQLYLDLLGAWVGDRIDITNPKAELNRGTISQIVWGYRRTFGGQHHIIEFACAQGAAFEIVEVADEVGDTNPWLGRLDTDDTVTLAAATAGATTLTVGARSGPLWTTNTDDYPLYLDVGGIQVRATAIANENLTNGTFETGITGWTSTGLTSFTQSSTQKHSGSFSCRCVPNGAATAVGLISNLVAVVPGQSVTVAGWAWFTNAVTANWAIGVSWYDAGQVFISTSYTPRSASAATWTQDSGTYTVPANAAFAACVPLITGTPAAGQIWYADDLSLTGPQKFTVDALPAARAAGLPVSVWHLPVLAQ